MRQAVAALAAVAALVSLCAAAARAPETHRATGVIELANWPYLPGSRVPVLVEGFRPPYDVAVLGTGSVDPGGVYAIPNDAGAGSATLVASNQYGLAQRSLQIGAAPSASAGAIVVASYDAGLVFHDERTFAAIGLLATGGVPSDVAVDDRARVVATDTQGTSLTVARLAPWGASRIPSVPLGDEIAIDRTTHAIFVTNRELDRGGALTRVAADGTVSSVSTGQTPEGLAIDEARQMVYVANVNDDSVAQVDAATMRLVRRFHAVARVFSLALSSDGRRLFATSNQSTGSPFAAPGSAVAIDVSANKPKIVERSDRLTFPLGVVVDARTRTVFVTDEAIDAIYVLDEATLKAKHAPLPTCRTPWKPWLDEQAQRLYVPCARADQVDVIDAATLRRVAGAPFRTGGYPLAVTAWHSGAGVNR